MDLRNSRGRRGTLARMVNTWSRPLTLALAVMVVCVEAPAHAQDAEIVSEAPPTVSVEESRSTESPVALDEPAALDARAVSEEELLHLNSWLEYLGRGARSSRLTVGSTMLVAGAIVTVAGAVIYVSSPTTELDKGLALALVGIGGVYTAAGIARLAKKSSMETLLVNWKAARTNPLTPRELGQFEGELRNYARLLDRSTRIARWASFGMGMTGALILGLTPAADLSPDARTTSYAIGGVLAGLGLLSFGFSFIGAGRDDVWTAYQKGQGPPRARWSAAPSFSRSFAGLSVQGRF